jgi:hypothetical protein
MDIGTLLIVASHLTHAPAPATLLVQAPPAQSATPAAAEGQPSVVQTTPFADNDFPTLLRNLKVRSTDLLEASLSVEDRGARLTYAPFLYGLINYRPVLSETRLSISQSNGVTTLGIGATYDPSSPRSSLGARLWKEKAPTSKPMGPYALALRNAAEAIVNEMRPLQEKVAEAIQAKDIQTRDALVEKIASLKSRADALTAESARALSIDTAQEAQRISTFYRDLLEANRPVITGSWTTSLFGIFGGTRQDANNNGLADNALQVKGRTLALSADFPLRKYTAAVTDAQGMVTKPSSWRWLQFSAAVTTEWQRSSQEEGTPFARVFGFGVTGGGIVKILNRDFENTQDYKDSFFIPSISAGASFERRQCTSDNDALCPDGIDTQSAVTPFVDIRVTKAAQFRVGAPVKFTRRVAGPNNNEVGLVAVYTIQLGAPK